MVAVPDCFEVLLLLELEKLPDLYPLVEDLDCVVVADEDLVLVDLELLVVEEELLKLPDLTPEDEDLLELDFEVDLVAAYTV